MSLSAKRAAICGESDVGAYLPFIYLPISKVCQSVGFSVSEIYVRIKAGEFPPGDLIGAQSRRWKSTDISKWLLEQSEKSAQREKDLAAPLRAKANKAVAARKALTAAVEGGA